MSVAARVLGSERAEQRGLGVRIERAAGQRHRDFRNLPRESQVRLKIYAAIGLAHTVRGQVVEHALGQLRRNSRYRRRIKRKESDHRADAFSADVRGCGAESGKHRCQFGHQYLLGGHRDGKIRRE